MHDARRLRNGGSMDQWMELAMRVQSIAQAGLTYGGTEYDKEHSGRDAVCGDGSAGGYGKTVFLQ